MEDSTKDFLAWVVVIGGVSLEIFIATLDIWIDMPHYAIHFGDNVHFTKTR